MVSLVEQLNDKERKAVIEDLNDRLQLDHDAVAAYEETISRLESQEHAETVAAFRRDHERHIRDLTAFVKRLGGTPKEKPHVTGILKTVLVTAASKAGGDKAILTAFRVNELQVRAKYDKYAAKQTYPAEVAEIIRLNAQDERRHYEWVAGVVGNRHQAGHVRNGSRAAFLVRLSHGLLGRGPVDESEGCARGEASKVAMRAGVEAFAVAPHGSAPVFTGTPMRLPYSVHEPS